ncbi:hypothetical protein niasHT_029662 [Heterodera trifolii]|uniref:Uncharacterized protein n=1 Tax=Heterodera trifolii TaxID=157864 RepID=A0ABD2K1T1_9BILA
MPQPSAPPLIELIQLQTVNHHNKAAPSAEMKHNYHDGTSNAYASSPVPTISTCSAPPPPAVPMSYMNPKQQHQHYQCYQQQQEPLMDGYGYAVPVVPMPNNDRNNVRSFCAALCRCRLKNVGMFCIAFVEFCISALLLSVGLWCLLETADFCPFYSALWTAALCTVTSLVGIVAAKVGTPTHWHVANLVLSLVSIVLCIGCAIISHRNWQLTGLYKGIHNPISRRDRYYCLIGEYDMDRMKHSQKQHKAYFNECLFKVKLGVAIMTAQLIFVILLAVIFTLTAIFCVRKIIIAARKR